MRVTAAALHLIHTLHAMDTSYVATGGVQAFRGTTKWKHVRANLAALTSDFHGIQVHRGFIHTYLEKQLVPPASRDEPVFVGGYSLGGALAIMRAVDLRIQGYNVSGVVTIASPRLIRPSSHDRLQRVLDGVPVARLYHVRDVVPRLPPHMAHFGAPVVVGATAPSTGGRVGPGHLPGWIESHLLGTYEESCRARTPDVALDVPWAEDAAE